MGRPTPAYWWDYEWSRPRGINSEIVAVVVESDYDEFPIVARISPPNYRKAERLIDDLKAGRANPRKLAAQISISEGQG